MHARTTTGRPLALAALMTAALLAAVALLAPTATATTTIGQSVYSTGGTMTVEVRFATAGYTSELWLFAPGPAKFVATNREVGKVVDLGTFPAGSELIFGIYVRNTGQTFYMGPAVRNPDGVHHAAVTDIGGGRLLVGFEDLYGGGDRDYDDNVFLFTGTTPVRNLAPTANAGTDRTVAVGPDCTASVTLDGTGSSDPDGDALAYAWTGSFGSASGATPSVTIGLGAHTVTLTVDDGNGGTDADDMVATATDATPPTAAASASATTLWPPNHAMRAVSFAVDAADNCGATTSRIVAIASDEPQNGLGDGDTDVDWRITGDLTADLRAERSGKGDGRVYTITVETTDGAGNVAESTVEVSVPHSKGKGK